MKVLTVKTIETLSPELQRDIHYTLRMEHHTDHIFRDREAAQYSATISIDDPDSVISIITEKSADIPEYTLVVDRLDMEENTIERRTIKAGKVLEKKTGNLEWNA
ncbi:MAG: hypothetical protein P1P82_09930 [Bacteroidales bacterium]|nr:hypothetical protein [Bacteroidales bacterium]MDT8431261.1 hypothetical protein [Bacteroidales bacterium]